MTWEPAAHKVITEGENVLGYLSKGLNALKSAPGIEAYIGRVPFLASFAERLIGLIPVVGQITNLLELADIGVENWQAIAALGAAIHFQPFDPGGKDLVSQRIIERSEETD